jgi:hypothetical protein
MKYVFDIIMLVVIAVVGIFMVMGLYNGFINPNDFCVKNGFDIYDNIKEMETGWISCCSYPNHINPITHEKVSDGVSCESIYYKDGFNGGLK